MKSQKLKKEIFSWEIMLRSRDNSQINSVFVLAFLINTVCFSLACLIKLCRNKNDFPAYTVCASLFMMASCFSFFFRMFFNRTLPCLIKTLPFSKSIYTVKLSILFETINTLFLLVIITGTFICFGKGYDSHFFYLLIIFFLFLYFAFSIMLPLTAKFFNNENRIYFFNLNGRISLQALNFFSTFVLLILPMLLVSFFAKPLAELFEPLSLHGLTIMTMIAVVVVIASCIINYFMFKKAYNQR